MKLDIAIGLLTVFMAVLGGIVSAHAPSHTKHKMIYIASFAVLGLLAVFLVILQARRSEHASAQAEERQNQLAGDMKTAKEDLKETRQMLLDAKLSQEHMKGQLEGLGAIASKVGLGNDESMKQLVGAINKMADSERIHTLTNKQLCDRTKDLVKNLREFGAQKNRELMGLVDRQMASARTASTNEEKQRLWQEGTQSQIAFYSAVNLEFRSNYLGEAIYLRDEMSKRLPSLPPSQSRGMSMFTGSLAGVNFGLFEGADYLEQLAKRLCLD